MVAADKSLQLEPLCRCGLIAIAASLRWDVQVRGRNANDPEAPFAGGFPTFQVLRPPATKEHCEVCKSETKKMDLTSTRVLTVALAQGFILFQYRDILE